MSTTETFPELLRQLKDPTKFVAKPARAIFDEHTDEFFVDARTGKMVPAGTPGARKVTKRFSKEALEHIARHNNDRARKGDLAPLTFGHTIPDDPREEVQPEIRGYAKDFGVRYDPARGRHVLTATYYIRRENYDDATTYPFTSIELWPEDGTIHPISLLRRTPQRDLGQWVYGRSLGTNGSTSNATSAWQFSRAAGAFGRLVMRYSMEAAPMAGKPWDDDTDADIGGSPEPTLGDDGPSAEEHMQFMKHCMSHPLAGKFAKHYAMQDADAEPAPEEPPAPDAPPEPPLAPPSALPMQNQRRGQPATGLGRFAVGEQAQIFQRLQAVESSIATTKQENAALRDQLANKEAEMWVTTLAQREGYEFANPEDEILRFARAYKHSGEAGCQEYAQHVRLNYRRSLTFPMGQIPLAPAPSAGGAPPEDSDGEINLALIPDADQRHIEQYARKYRLWDKTPQEIAALALPAKYGRNRAAANGTANGTH